MLEENIEYYDNGNTKCAFSLNVFNKRQGYYTHWYRNGKIMLECFFVNGRLEGEYKEYHDNGNIMLKCTYHRGVENGKMLRYNKDGSLFTKCIFKNGVLDGAFKIYQKGELWKTEYYLNGKQLYIISK